MRKGAGGSSVNDISAASKARCVSGVTNEPSHMPNVVEGTGETCSTPSAPSDVQLPVTEVDWNTLTILEDKLYEAM